MSGCVVVFGEASVDMIASSLPSMPKLGESVFTPNLIATVTGGGGLNTAMSLAKLNHPNGAEVIFLGPIGDDTSGAFLTENCKKHHVTLPMKPLSDVSTTICIILAGEDGEKAIVESKAGACSQWKGDDVDWKSLSSKGLTLVHFGGLALLQSITSTQLIGIIKEIRDAAPNVIITVDTNTITSERFKELMEEALCDIDVLLPNKEELLVMAATLSDSSKKVDCPKEAGALLLQKLRKSQSRMVAWSDSSNGATICASHPDGSIHYFSCNAVKPIDALDTTGAGDAFNAGLLHAMLQGQCPQDALKFGCAAGAVACTRTGGANPPVSREEVAPLLEKLSVESTKA